MLCWAVWVVRSKLVLEGVEEDVKALTTKDTKVHKGKSMSNRADSLDLHEITSGGFSFVDLCALGGSRFES
jgi:hypothetical protein